MTAGSAAFVFAVVAEARADKQIACELAERILVEEIDWVETESLPELVSWQGFEASSEFLSWPAISRHFKEAGLVSHGKFRSKPGAFDERRARKALLLFNKPPRAPTGVLLVRDTDGELQSAESLERARQARNWGFEVIILATPHPKRESWVLAGFEPQNEVEQRALDGERSTLGFDPRQKAERLTAKGTGGKRNAKKVLAKLAGGFERERACWCAAELDVLRERGEGSRLAAYLTEVADRLVPLFAGRISADGGS